jgi:hypothetical protein
LEQNRFSEKTNEFGFEGNYRGFKEKLSYRTIEFQSIQTMRGKMEPNIISIPDGKICDYVDQKFRNDTPLARLVPDKRMGLKEPEIGDTAVIPE